MLREKQYSQRKIAVQLGVSRGTVNSIATGRRLDYAQRHKTDENNAGEPNFTPPTGMPRRCQQCGARVMMPCLACHVRALAAHGKVDPQRVDSHRSARC